VPEVVLTTDGGSKHRMSTLSTTAAVTFIIRRPWNHSGMAEPYESWECFESEVLVDVWLRTKCRVDSHNDWGAKSMLTYEHARVRILLND